MLFLRGEAEVALRGDRPVEEHRETLARVVQLAGQMGRLVEDLLFLARAEVGAVRFDMEPLVLQDLLEIALSEARVLAGERDQMIAPRLPEARLRVVNTGPGIPRADLPLVFHRFYRGRQEGGRTTEGSGLGLSIAKWILDTHGGQIEIESDAGRIAVTLCLPLRS